MIIPVTKEFMSFQKKKKVRDRFSNLIGSIDRNFKDKLDYHISCLVNKFWDFDANVAKNLMKWGMRLKKQMRSVTVNAFYVISDITFLSPFEMECSTSWIHEGAAMWLFHDFMKD